jgi:hypothetical protein
MFGIFPLFPSFSSLMHSGSFQSLLYNKKTRNWYGEGSKMT